MKNVNSIKTSSNKVFSEKKPTYLSLFSGCGGFDEGFDQCGFECKGAFDNDATVIEVYKQNMQGPVFKHNLENTLLPINIEPGEIDVVLSGSPCQGFSTAGLRKLDDPRNNLLVAGGEIALKLRPKVFVAENVMGSLSGDHKMYWERLIRLFESAGYNIKFLVLEGEKVGLAQIRKRIFLIAWQGVSEVNFDIEHVGSKSLKEALDGVASLPNQNIYNEITDGKIKSLVSKIRPGQRLSNVRGGKNCIHTWDVPSVFGEVNNSEVSVLEAIRQLRRKVRRRKNGDSDPVSKENIELFIGRSIDQDLQLLLEKNYVRKVDDKYDLVHTYNGLYKRLVWEKPSMTVDTQFGNPRFFLHPEENRGLSVREAARIQGFRDSFIFSGPVEKQYKMIGNAVPPPMATIIAKVIKNRILSHAEN